MTADLGAHERVIDQGFSEFARVGRDLIDAEANLTPEQFGDYCAAMKLSATDVARLLPLAKQVLR